MKKAYALAHLDGERELYFSRRVTYSSDRPERWHVARIVMETAKAKSLIA